MKEVTFQTTTSNKGTTSPYFFRSNPTSSSVRSTYFLKSPSSVYGSIQSLGPLIYTWATMDPDLVAKCTRRAAKENTNDIICASCQRIIDNASRHFLDCSKVRVPEDLSSTIIRQQRAQMTMIPCVELIGKHMERSVRHLCEHGCYLRAYAPCREWFTLRQTLSARMDTSTDTVLRNWTCRLIERETNTTASCSSSADKEEQQRSHEGNESSEKPPRIQKRRRLSASPTNSCQDFRSSSLPRVVFLSRSEEKSYSIAHVLRRLEMEKGDQMDDQQASNKESSDNNVNEDSRLSSRCSTTNRRQHRASCRRLTFENPTELPLSPVALSGPTIFSPLGLLEELFADDPWRLLLSTIFLNRTRRIQVDVVMFRYLQRWPTAEATIAAVEKNDNIVTQMSDMIAPLGIKYRRAKGIVRFSREYLDLLKSKSSNCSSLVGLGSTERITNKNTNDNESVSFQLTRAEIQNLYHCGEYAADAYQIFVQKDWKTMNRPPRDHALLAYVEWQKGRE